MKIIIIILVLIGAAWAGNYFYINHAYKNSISASSVPVTKCITADGNVIYGKVPDDVTCQRIEPIKGSLTIVPSQGEIKIDQPVSSTTNTTRVSVNTTKCDGRTHCSQMTSCEEAKYFLNNCPGVKMDGNQDGIPCEQQWCN
jgi:Excalibur calcium-binding domain